MKSTLESYYEKFDEAHRLKTRHGQVEFFVTMHYIKNQIFEMQKKFAAADDAKNFLDENSSTQNSSKKNSALSNSAIKILDVGAGTGAYSLALCDEGFDVTAVELTKCNFKKIRSLKKNIKCWNADARSMPFLQDETFDVTLLLGPLYHLQSEAEKLRALSEARRVTKTGGSIFAAYCMNEYAILKYCFEKNKIKENFLERQVDENFKTLFCEKNLYSYSRLSEIDLLAKKSCLKRIAIFSPDGPADYMRRALNSFDAETFELFKKYVLCVSARADLLGAGSHLVDVLKK